MEMKSKLQLVLSQTKGIFPNGAVPMAVALQYFQRRGLQVITSEVSPEVARTHFLDPRSVTDSALQNSPVKNVIWRYRNEREANTLSNAFVEQLEDNVPCGQGVLDALNWCLFEVMDNVLQHSRAESGYAMLQIHHQQRWCAVAVADDGIGIYNSFRESNVYKAKDEYEAIMLSVREKVTSKAKNMGNGLFGLMRVVGLNGGQLEIRSGRGWLTYKNQKLSGDYRQSLPVLDVNEHRGTTVDWQLDVSKKVSLSEALGSPQANFRMEKIEDTDGEHRVMVADFEDGLGTRRSAEQARIKLLNYLSDGIPRLVLDFDGINVVSSSFADEVLGKLALQMGLVQFINRLRLDHMSDTVEAIINRAIQQRIAEGDIGHPGSARN
jgi:anti-anti-sigma regulatory factor